MVQPLRDENACVYQTLERLQLLFLITTGLKTGIRLTACFPIPFPFPFKSVTEPVLVFYAKLPSTYLSPVLTISPDYLNCQI